MQPLALGAPTVAPAQKAKASWYSSLSSANEFLQYTADVLALTVVFRFADMMRKYYTNEEMYKKWSIILTTISKAMLWILTLNRGQKVANNTGSWNISQMFTSALSKLFIADIVVEIIAYGMGKSQDSQTRLGAIAVLVIGFGSVLGWYFGSNRLMWYGGSIFVIWAYYAWINGGFGSFGYSDVDHGPINVRPRPEYTAASLKYTYY